MNLITFNGNKPDREIVHVGVKGNNYVDTFCFVVSAFGDIALNEYTDIKIKVKEVRTGPAFVEMTSNNLSAEFIPERNSIKVIYKAEDYITSLGAVRMQLVFEKPNESENPLRWQTQMITVVFADTISIHDGLKDKYPDIVRDLTQTAKVVAEQASTALNTSNDAFEKSSTALDTANQAEANSTEALQYSSDSYAFVENLNTTIVTAETERVNAENGRIENEKQRQASYQQAQKYEEARENAENLRELSEIDRINAEKQRGYSESEREENETVRESFEEERQEAEALRVQKENERFSAETTRIGAENQRVANESSRVTAENSRVGAEGSRASAETKRVNAEANREIKENERVSAESARVEAERLRVQAETNRTSSFTASINECNTATAEAKSAASQALGVIVTNASIMTFYNRQENKYCTYQLVVDGNKCFFEATEIKN